MLAGWFIISQLPFGEATVIIFAAPILTALLARVLLGELLTYAQWGLVAVSAGGVVLVARPGFLGFETEAEASYQTHSRTLVVAVGLTGAFCSACTNIMVRKLSQVHAMVILSE
jgi:drug/metabolite transporter (DMT)-like permease